MPGKLRNMFSARSEVEGDFEDFHYCQYCGSDNIRPFNSYDSIEIPDDGLIVESGHVDCYACGRYYTQECGFRLAHRDVYPIFDLKDPFADWGR